MIAGILHEGSGLGDQLFRYITVRTLAEEKGYMFGMKNNENYKGRGWLKLDMGNHPSFYKFSEEWNEKDVRENGLDIRSYDPEINFVEDNTIVDGSFEDSKYWGHNLENINNWLAVEPLGVPDNVCVIGFRGGEYAGNPDLFLPKEYYEEAIGKMRNINSAMHFQVHTDDEDLALRFFNDERYKNQDTFEVIENKQISHSKHSNMGLNWRSARYAKYAIIPNSAFYIIPRLLKQQADPTTVTIAPRYWARHNTKTWARPACYYKEFTYI